MKIVKSSTKYILPLIVLIYQFLFLGVYSFPEPPELPERPSLEELSKSLDDLNMNFDNSSVSKKLNIYDSKLRIKNLPNENKKFKFLKIK